MGYLEQLPIGEFALSMGDESFAISPMSRIPSHMACPPHTHPTVGHPSSCTRPRHNLPPKSSTEAFRISGSVVADRKEGRRAEAGVAAGEYDSAFI